MKNTLSFLSLFLVLYSVHAQSKIDQSYFLDFTKNLDTIYVQAEFSGRMPKGGLVYQFAATAPGTYQTMNIGRLVTSFQAFDKDGKSILVEKKGVNQYLITKTKKLSKITYRVAETFDTDLEEYKIYLMCGSSIEEDHVLINPHTMIGYLEGYQGQSIKVYPITPKEWVTGTALELKDGYYLASDYDELVDSPILSGHLTKTDTTIANTQVNIYTYSENDLINSDMLLKDMSGMLDAAREFLVDLPVDKYTFLYFFEENMRDKGATGAWEHSYSSEYVLTESDPTPKFMKSVTDIASHEFFHIVTPLNIHSEVVEEFNFVTPTPSVHLWMYEGVTEWASNILLFRGGVLDADEYIQGSIARKITIDEKYFDSTWSLKKLSEESFNTEGSKQYGNIYYRGSLVAGLLDIRLLELSEGTFGLRELVLELVKKYGKGKPVSEKTFFDDITQMTFPEIKAFFNSYILDNQPLPHKEYLAKIGLELTRNEEGKPSIKRMEEMSEKQAMLYKAWSVNMSLKK